MNSIISWVGGKKALRDLIYLRMPKNYDRYIEVFVVYHILAVAVVIDLAKAGVRLVEPCWLGAVALVEADLPPICLLFLSARAVLDAVEDLGLEEALHGLDPMLSQRLLLDIIVEVLVLPCRIVADHLLADSFLVVEPLVLKDSFVVGGVVLLVDGPVYLLKRRAELCQSISQSVVERLDAAVFYRTGAHADHHLKFLASARRARLRSVR